MCCRNFRILFFALSRMALLLIAVGSATTASAASPSELAQEAEALARQGNMPGAMQRMQQAADALWGLQQLKIIEAKSLNVGDLQQVPKLLSGEDLSVSILLAGFGYERSDDTLSVSFSVDVDILHASGRVLASMQDFASVTQTVPGRVAEFAIEMSLKTPALLDGEYEAAFTLRDLASGQSAQFTQDFKIEGIVETKPEQVTQ